MRANHSYKKIVELAGVSKTCVALTIEKFKTTNSVADKKRPGRPRVTSIQEDWMIFREARKKPHFSAKIITSEIRLGNQKIISSRTVQRRLVERKLISYDAVRKPLLKPTFKIKRLNFCRKIFKLSQYQVNKFFF